VARPRLFHFSEYPSIEIFTPRSVAVPSPRPPGQDWLNGSLVWAVDECRQATYLFPVIEQGVELRVMENLTPLKDVWATMLHATGIRLRNAKRLALSLKGTSGWDRLWPPTSVL
jgi:hypothetical protein